MDIRLRSNHNLDDKTAECKKKSLIEKANDHKKEIAIGVVTILSVVAIVMVVKNKDIIKETIRSTHSKGDLANSLETRNNVAPTELEVISTSSTANSSIVATNVRGHVRNLPKGWKPSTSNIEVARKSGHCLDEHQTWVNPYTKIAA